MRFTRIIQLTILALLASQTAQAQQFVCMESTQGDFCMKMLPESAPKTVSNFLNYVTDGDYTQTLIHRSVPGFIIQGGGFYGGPTNLGTNVPADAAVVNEFSRSNLRSTVAMAKLGSDPNSATNQWFINLANNAANLDNQNGGFTVFAEIVYGMEAVDKIASLRLVNLVGDLGSAFTDVPVTTPASSNSIALTDLVLINRAYATDTAPNTSPYACSYKSLTGTLTEFCATSLILPVQIGAQFYQATMELQAASPTLIFTVATSSLKLLTETPAEFATFNATTSALTIPSVRKGDKTFLNVVLTLTDKPSLQFTLSSFTKG